MNTALQKDTSNIEFLYSRKDFKKFKLKRYFRFKQAFKKDLNSDKTRIIKGYAGTIDQDRVDDIITLDAWKKSKNDLIRPGSKTVFLNHDRAMPIGVTEATNVDSKGLFITVKISKAKDVEDVWTKIKEGVFNSFSIGGRFKKVQVERDNEGSIIAFKVLELELFEVSVVGIPANPKASITEVIEKRFKPLLKRNKKMGKKADEKEVVKKDEEVKETVVKKEEVKESKETVMTEETVKNLIAESQKPIQKLLTDLTETIGTLVSKKDETKEEKTEKSDEMPAWAKNLSDKMETMQKDMNKTPSRKGFVSETDEEEEEETEVDSTPEKCLDIKDEKSKVFVKWAMDNPEDGFDKLSAGEKTKANHIYFQMLNNSKKVRNNK